MPRLRSHRLPDKLLRIRAALGITRSELLERLGLAGILTEKNIETYESGRNDPSLVVLLRYARLVSVSADLLIDDELNLPETLLVEAHR